MSERREPVSEGETYPAATAGETRSREVYLVDAQRSLIETLTD